MSRAPVVIALSALMFAAGCRGDEADRVAYRPSLTQLRVGDVVVDDPPTIPEARYIPGIVIKPEDYDLSAGRMAPDPRWRTKTDLRRLEAADHQLRGAHVGALGAHGDRACSS